MSGWNSTGCLTLVGVDTIVDRIWDLTVGEWFHRFINTYHYQVTGLDETTGKTYMPTVQEGYYLNSINRNRIDDSGQWMVTWDEYITDPDDGTYYNGFNPDDYQP
jgi:hypothetical protein